jgi:cobalt-zinc-cadmium efflux system membrane fusion protein
MPRPRTRACSRFALAIALATAPACTREREATPSPEAAPSAKPGEVTLGGEALTAARIELQKPRKATARTTVTIAGTIDFAPDRVARVGAVVEGRVASVKVKPGQGVRVGDELATLTSVAAGAASASVVSARARLSQADKELARQKLLFESHATSESALLAAQTTRDLAAADLARASAETQALGASGTTTITLRAPLDGDVLAAEIRVGQAVAASDVLFVVGRTDEVWLSFDVYERDVGRVHVGDAARVTLLAYPERVFEGKVDHLGLLVDPLRRALPARVVLANPDGALKPGLSATARILGAPVPSAGAPPPTVLLVPRAALQSFAGSPIVFVQRSPASGTSGGGASFEARPVERGAELGDDVEIVRGLSEGESVVVAGAFVLKSELLRDQMGKND